MSEMRDELQDRLKATGTRLKRLSDHVTDVSARGFSAAVDGTKRTARALGERIDGTKEHIQSMRESRREDREDQARQGLKEPGLMDDIPAMITLPEWEQEQLRIAEEQFEIQMVLVEQLELLSKRTDRLETMVDAIRDPGASMLESSMDPSEKVASGPRSNAEEILFLLGVTFLTFSSLLGFEWLTREWVPLGGQPVAVYAWTVGLIAWFLFSVHRLRKSRFTVVARGQLSVAIGGGTALAIGYLPLSASSTGIIITAIISMSMFAASATPDPS